MEKDMDEQLKLKFLMFENDTNSNLCWLDASIVLIAHNRTFKKIVESSPESQIKRIISIYNEAIAIFNSSDCEELLESREMLKAIQVNTLEYLKQFLKFKPGEPDSAFCALLNLIYQDKSDVKECLNVSWIWRKQCPSCGTNSKSAICKPIITLSKVNAFHPECPSTIYTCTCKSEREMKVIYKELPPCLIFHFENGAGAGSNFPLAFSIKSREYQLTSMVLLEKSSNSDLNINHFVTLIRDPASNTWLECNDLNTAFVSFRPGKPEVNFKDIYVAVYEAFDDLGRINNEIATDQEQVVENDNVELIYLSDEENDTANTGLCCKTTISESSESIKKELFTDNKKDIALQNLKMCDDEKSEESEDKCKIEDKSKALDYLDQSVDYFVGSKESRNEVTNNTEDKVSESSVASKKETLSWPSVNNETSTIEKLEMHGNEEPKESEEDCNISYQKISVSNFNLPNKLSLSKCKTEVKSDKAVEKSPEAKKFKAKATDNPEHKVTETSDENKKENYSRPANKNTSAIQNLEISGNEKIKKNRKTCNISSQNISLNARRFSNESSNKHEVVVKSKNSNYQNKPVNESVKEFIAEATKYPEHTDSSIRNKKGKKNNSFDPDTVVENVTTDEEPSLTKCGFVEDTSNVRKNEVNKHDEKKSQIEMKQIPLKRSFISNNNENKYFSSNEKKRGRTEDKYATSTKRRKERSGGKDVSPNKEKSVAILNDQTASTSQADDEFPKSTLLRSKRSSDSNFRRKKIKMSNSTDSNSDDEEKIRCMVDNAVRRTFAAFFEHIIGIHETNKRKSDTAT